MEAFDAPTLPCLRAKLYSHIYIQVIFLNLMCTKRWCEYLSYILLNQSLFRWDVIPIFLVLKLNLSNEVVFFVVWFIFSLFISIYHRPLYKYMKKYTYVWYVHFVWFSLTLRHWVNRIFLLIARTTLSEVSWDKAAPLLPKY